MAIAISPFWISYTIFARRKAAGTPNLVRRALSFLHKVVVPRDATDLANDRPPIDITMIATKASLVVRRDLHPAIQYLLLTPRWRSIRDQPFSTTPTDFLPPKPSIFHSNEALRLTKTPDTGKRTAA